MPAIDCIRVAVSPNQFDIRVELLGGLLRPRFSIGHHPLMEWLAGKRFHHGLRHLRHIFLSRRAGESSRFVQNVFSGKSLRLFCRRGKHAAFLGLSP